MKILQINQTCEIGSTGRIMYELNNVIQKNGHRSSMVSAYCTDDKIENLYSINKGEDLKSAKRNILISRITGTTGYRHKKDTRKIINFIKTQSPDIVHLHNIHGDWINIELLFFELKLMNIPIVWTLHDCWSFTGRCSHYTKFGCTKWKDGCCGCKNKNVYPISYFFDKSEKMWIDKRNWFSAIDKMEIITPSHWLANQVKMSFLGNYNITVVPNGLDVDIFKPPKLNHNDKKKIILGVANSWNEKKGLNLFLELDKKIDHSTFQIMIVGLNKRQMNQIPSSIIGIERTNNLEELVEHYQNAFIFLNPSIEETQGMTTIEAMSCGVPVVVSNCTAVPECVGEMCGIILENLNIESIYEAILKIYHSRNEYSTPCRKHILKYYNKEKNFEQYLSIYHKLL